MRSPRMSSVGKRLLLVVGVLLAICSVFVSSIPQWAWSPDSETGPKATSGSGNRLVFGEQKASSEKEKPNIKLDDTQARLFLPSILNAVGGGGRPEYDPIRQTTNFRPPLGGVSGVFSNFLQNIFGGGASTLPANIGGIGGSSSGSRSCVCVERSRGCYLPFATERGGCDSGTRVMCCQSVRGGGSRIILPSDFDSSFTSTNAVRSVTRSEIRRALLKNIVRGSGSLIDDTLDLFLHPFLNKEDQREVAIRVLSDS